MLLEGSECRNGKKRGLQLKRIEKDRHRRRKEDKITSCLKKSQRIKLLNFYLNIPIIGGSQCINNMCNSSETHQSFSFYSFAMIPNN